MVKDMSVKLMCNMFVVLMIGFCVSCSDATSPNLGDEIDLDFGQLTTLSGRDFSVKFEGVVGDSRCPTGAVYVWEGNAEILLKATSGALEETYSLSTTLEPKQIEHDGYLLELISVSPYPDMDEELTEDDYSIIVSVTR